MLQFASLHPFVFPVNLCMQYIANALIIFTDGLFNGKAAHVVRSLVYSLEFPPFITQITDLHPEVTVFEMLTNQGLNLYTDIQYIVHG